jgi:hypothetical protein
MVIETKVSRLLGMEDFVDFARDEFQQEKIGGYLLLICRSTSVSRSKIDAGTWIPNRTLIHGVNEESPHSRV